MKEKHKGVVMAIVVGFLMITSVIGIMFVNYGDVGTNSLKYGNYNFQATNNGIVTKINGKDVPFTYFPTEIQNIPVSNNTIERIKNSKYILTTSYSNSSIKQAIASVQYDIGISMMDHFNSYVLVGFTDKFRNFPEVNCNNATQYVPVIKLQEGNSTLIYEDGQCIILEAPDENEMIKLRDRLMFGYLGVMK